GAYDHHESVTRVRGGRRSCGSCEQQQGGEQSQVVAGSTESRNAAIHCRPSPFKQGFPCRANLNVPSSCVTSRRMSERSSSYVLQSVSSTLYTAFFQLLGAPKDEIDERADGGYGSSQCEGCGVATRPIEEPPRD